MQLPAPPSVPARRLVSLLVALAPCPAAFALVDPPTVSVAATDVLRSSAGVTTAADQVEMAAGEEWFAFDVEIPVAGRYRVEVTARAATEAAATIHLEDAIDNQDGRHYDITAGMPVLERAFAVVHKDGSPLNQGLHRMKLHAAGGGAVVKTITFILLKEHEPTPRIMEQATDGEAWKLVWSDEFDTDGQPDPEIWAHDIGNWGWGNNEPQYYTEGRLENARVEDGRLIVEARKDRDDGGWSSARLTTRGRVSFLYGRLEFRAKTTTGRGNWAAIWMLGDSYRDEISWPYCGEIDILENVGREIDDATGAGLAHFSCHTRAYYFKQNNHISATKEVPNLGNEFHDYALEWTPEAVKIFFDGEHVYTYDKQGSDLEYPFREPQNLIINMAMGGGMGGEIDPALTRERMEVDYIRLYGRPADDTAGDDVTLEERADRVVVRVAGEPFTEYLFGGDRLRRPVLFPIHGPHGLPLTRSWPVGPEREGEPRDHPHQESFWFAHGDVNGHDFWTCQDGSRIEQLSLDRPAAGRIETANRWLDPAGQPVCTDRRVIEFSAAGDDRIIDHTITITASHGPVVFGDTKEGTMAVRVRPELNVEQSPGGPPATGQYRNAAGDRDAAAWGKPAAWVDLSGTLDGRAVGIACFDHPDNLRHPTCWHARGYGLFAANPFGLHDFTGAARAAGRFELPAGESLTLRHRWLLHPGDAETARIAERYQAWAEGR